MGCGSTPARVVTPVRSLVISLDITYWTACLIVDHTDRGVYAFDELPSGVSKSRCKNHIGRYLVTTETAPPTQHPLGPLVWRSHPESTGKARLAALVTLAVSSAILMVAWRLSPDPTGLGTHTQLGLAPCSLVRMTGYPCPTCGMTTAFSYTVRGQVVQAFLAQPTGLVLAITTIAASLISVVVLVTGRVWRLNWYRITPAKLGGGVMAIILLGWAFKVAMVLIDGS